MTHVGIELLVGLGGLVEFYNLSKLIIEEPKYTRKIIKVIFLTAPYYVFDIKPILHPSKKLEPQAYISKLPNSTIICVGGCLFFRLPLGVFQLQILSLNALL